MAALYSSTRMIPYYTNETLEFFSFSFSHNGEQNAADSACCCEAKQKGYNSMH